MLHSVLSKRSVSFALVALATVAALAACSSPGPAATPVSNVTAVPVPGGVLVTWDGGAGARSFVILRQAEGAAAEEVADVPSDVRAYSDYTTDPATSYVYSVAAVGPAGVGQPVAQQGDPVSPAPGVRLTLRLEGTGAVQIDGADTPVVCTTECIVGVTAGTVLTLLADSDDMGFAGFSAPCGSGTTCQLTMTEDVTVTATFRSQVLRLSVDGDAAVDVKVSPPDQAGRDSCRVAPGEECVLGFSYQASGPLQVSVSVTPVDGAAARVVGLKGSCTSTGRFCVVEISGQASVVALSAVVPQAANDAFAVAGGGTSSVPAPGVLGNDQVGSVVSAELVQEPATGEVDLDADGSFTFTSPSGSQGTVQFTYRAVGAHGVASEPATVTLDLAAPPTAVDKVFSVLEDRTLEVSTDDGLLSHLASMVGYSAEVVSQDAAGTLEVASNGSFRFTPAQDFAGTFSFTYRVVGPLGTRSDPATVSITVTPVNDPPTFQLPEPSVRVSGRFDSYSFPAFATNISRGGGTDESAQRLTFRVDQQGGSSYFNGTPRITADGTLTFRTGWFTGRQEVMFKVELQDDGGTANGGDDTSAEREFMIVLDARGGGDDDDDDDD